MATDAHAIAPSLAARSWALHWPRLDAGRVLLIVIAAWAIALIAPEAYRVLGTLGSFGLVANNDGVIVDVTGPFSTAAQSPAAAAGIVAGDRIDLDAMRCIPPGSARCQSLLSVLGGLGGTQIVRPDRTLELVIQPAAGGPGKVVRMQSKLPVRGFVDRLVLLADTVVGIIVVLAAARLVWLHPGRMTWGFFLYAMWFNPGQTFAYYALLQPWPVAILIQEICEALAHGAGFAGLLVFALRFPFDARGSRLRRFEWIAYCVGAIITALWLASFANAFGLRTEAVSWTAILVGYAVDALVVFILVTRRRTLPPLDRQRMLWVISGCVIGLPAFIFAEIAQSTSLFNGSLHLSPPVIGLLYLLNGVLVYFVSVAVLHRRVVSVSIPLRHGTILTALSLAVGIPIVNLHELLSHYQDRFPIPEWVWLLVVAPVALVLLQRLHEIGVHVVDRLLNRRYYAARRHLSRVDKAMLDVQDADEIDRMLAKAPRQALKLTSGSVFRQQDGIFRRRCAFGSRESTLHALRRKPDAAVLRSVETCKIVRLPRDEWDGPGLEAKLQEPCIAVPVCSDVLGSIAIALYGPHENGNDIDEDECEMLADLARHAATGYERAQFAGLRREVADLRSRLALLLGAHA
jgi:hypothetical protein